MVDREYGVGQDDRALATNHWLPWHCGHYCHTGCEARSLLVALSFGQPPLLLMNSFFMMSMVQYNEGWNIANPFCEWCLT